jgi:hypothetical protein
MRPNVHTKHRHVIAVRRRRIDSIDDATTLQQLDRGALRPGMSGDATDVELCEQGRVP